MTTTREPSDDSPMDKTMYVRAGAEQQASASNAEAHSRVGQMFGEFKLLRRLGKGGMAEVWLAEQSKPKRNVALKFMHTELMNDPLYVKRFEREADAAAGLSHSNIVQVYSTGTTESQHYIVQEYVDGQTLREYLSKLTAQKKRITVAAALQIMRQTAAALEAASSKGIVHRDIKPENIMLNEKGMVKVADFGLAQIEQGGEKLNLTQADTTMGTPLYMSPEQIRAEKLDQRSDLYSFGVMSYYMLCGQTPFKGDSAMAVAVQHLNDVPPSLLERRNDLPKPLCDLVHKLLRKKPEDRYQSFTEVLEDIRSMFKAHKSGTLSEITIADAEPDESVESPAKRLLGQRPWLTLALLMFLTGSASAGVGWLLRTRTGDPSQAPANIHQLPTAKEQFLQAMFLADNEEAWKSVGKYFRNETTEKLWVNRAEEQLLLFYLKDKSREPEARKQSDVLKGLRQENERFFAEGRLAEAYLAAGNGELSTAKSIIEVDRTRFDEELQGAWRGLYQDLRRKVYGGPPENGFRPGKRDDRGPGPGNRPSGDPR